MNDTQRIVIVGLTMITGATMAFEFLNFGVGAFSGSGEDRIAILVLSGQGPDSINGPGYGIYTKKGIRGVLLGLLAPIGLFVGAVFVALGAKKQD